jgi:predicted amidohydrolase
MRIGHAQIEVKYNDFDANLAKITTYIERAVRDRVEILCFPECSLTGYPDTEEGARKCAFAADSPQLMKVLDRTSKYDLVVIVGYNELRGKELYNTAVVLYKGHVLGSYSKCSAYMPFHKQGREFPIFEHKKVKFGVIICSDGGFIEPTRILALKGAKIVFAPHFNYIGKEGLLGHYRHVRADHTARAVENNVYFVRGNNVIRGKDAGITKYDGVGYGDSYIVDPAGQFVLFSKLHQEDLFFLDVDPPSDDKAWTIGKSAWSAREFGPMLNEAMQAKLKK